MMLETLESRRLMSVSLDAVSGLLTVKGRDTNDPSKADVIQAWVSGTSLKVSDNGALHSFALAKVKKIAVYALAGDDKVTIDPTVTLPTLLDSGYSGLSGDLIKGGSGPDTIILRGSYGIGYGGAGNDLLQNYGGGVRFYGEAGNDTIVSKLSSTSESRYEGGTGVDTMDYSMATVDMVVRNGTSGEYLPDVSPPLVASYYADTVSGMENLFAGSGDDYVYGNAANNILKGGAGNDQLRGGDGNDTLYGGAGEDAMFGEAGNDTFFSKGDGKIDFLSGGLGTDKANRDAADIINSVEASF